MATTPTFATLPKPTSSDHKWTQQYQAFLKANDVAGYYAWLQSNKPQFLPGGSMANDPRANGGTGPTTTPGGSSGGTTAPPVAGTGTGAVPLGTPTPINVGGQANTISRFGPGGLSAYNVGTSYAGQESPPGAPSSVPPPSGGLLSSGPPAPVPVPPAAPPPASSPVPSSPVPQIPGTGGSGVPAPGGGTGGNPRQGQQAGLGGFGGNSGFGTAAGGLLSGGPSGGSFTGNSASPPAGQSPSDLGYIDLGPWGSAALGTAATLAPGWAGVGLGALQAGMRGYNTINTNKIRGDQGIPDTDIGQFLGSLVGGNNYGGTDGNATVANPEQLGQRLGQVPAYNMANDFFGRFGAPAETAAGGTYNSGPGGLLGLLFGGADTRALAPGEVNHMVKQTMDPDIAALWGGGGNAAGGSAALGAVRSPGSSGASMTTGAAGVRGIGAGNLAPLSPKDQAALDLYNAKNGYDANGKASSGMADNGQSNPFGQGRGFDAGNNSNDRSSANTNAAGQASNATGSYGQRGIGAGTYAKGGYVGGRPPLSHDERDLAFTAMAERFGPEKAAAIMNQIAPAQGQMQGPPAPRGYAQRIGPRPDMLGMTPDTNRMPVNGPPQAGGYSGDRELEMLAEMDAEKPELPLPGWKPPQPGMGIEGGWPVGLLSAPKAKKGKKGKKANNSISGPSESDLLNMAELARHPPQNLRAGGKVAGKPDNTTDNRPIMADEKEFVVKRSAAKAAGPGLLNAINDPRKARKLRGLLSAA